MLRAHLVTHSLLLPLPLILLPPPLLLTCDPLTNTTSTYSPGDPLATTTYSPGDPLAYEGECEPLQPPCAHRPAEISVVPVEARTKGEGRGRWAEGWVGVAVGWVGVRVTISWAEASAILDYSYSPYSN